MTELTLHRETRELIKPEPREGPISIRKAVPGPQDIAFIDGLQKMHSKMVGFLRWKALEGHIAKGRVLIAEEGGSTSAIGYIVFADKYRHREELGICYQLNIVPGRQRGLVGAALVQAAFDACAYGTKLFCCWCAQDIEANHFWESIGFVPLAFRAGSRGKAQGGRRKDQRIHIFWQKRIREGDEQTAWWYPTETQGGALGEGRIALPIEPGTHWSDAKLIVLPGMEGNTAPPQALTDESEEKSKRQSTKKRKAAVEEVPMCVQNGLRFGEPPVAAKVKAPKPKREKQKNDPKLVAAAREFRDRYLEEVNAEGGDRLLAWNGKYDVSRAPQLETAASSHMAIEQLPAAALLNAA